jgi:hypothetical protein
MGSTETPENVSTDFSLMVIGIFSVQPETRITRQPTMQGYVLGFVDDIHPPAAQLSQRYGSERWFDRSFPRECYGVRSGM